VAIGKRISCSKEMASSRPRVVVLLGEAGAGKSTLASRLYDPGLLLSEDIFPSDNSDTGVTRTCNGARVLFERNEFEIWDTPGFREGDFDPGKLAASLRYYFGHSVVNTFVLVHNGTNPRMLSGMETLLNQVRTNFPDIGKNLVVIFTQFGVEKLHATRQHANRRGQGTVTFQSLKANFKNALARINISVEDRHFHHVELLYSVPMAEQQKLLEERISIRGRFQRRSWRKSRAGMDLRSGAPYALLGRFEKLPLEFQPDASFQLAQGVQGSIIEFRDEEGESGMLARLLTSYPAYRDWFMRRTGLHEEEYDHFMKIRKQVFRHASTRDPYLTYGFKYLVDTLRYFVGDWLYGNPENRRGN